MLKPDVVVCPDPEAVFFGQSYFNHRDHRIVGWATLDAVAPAAANPHYFPTAGPAHQVECVYLSGTLAPDVWVDISATVDDKAEALLCHQSQLGETGEWLRTAVRERAEEAGRAAGVAYAEGFRRLSLGGSSPSLSGCVGLDPAPFAHGSQRQDRHHRDADRGDRAADQRADSRCRAAVTGALEVGKGPTDQAASEAGHDDRHEGQKRGPGQTATRTASVRSRARRAWYGSCRGPTCR